jgi:Zn-dependent membrane protease YugP
MPFWDNFLDLQTTLRQGDAREAVVLFGSCVKNALGANGVVTDPNLCKQITCNPLLAEACRRKELTWNCPSFGTLLWVFFRGAGRVFMAVLLFPCSIFVSFYAQYRLSQIIANQRPLPKSGHQPPPSPPSQNQTAGDYVRDKRVQKQICDRSGSESQASCGEDQSLGSCYYSPIPHRVTLPKCVAKSCDPEALAFASHECGHAEQRTFLLVKLVACITAAGAVVVSCILLSCLPNLAGILMLISVSTLLSMPLIAVFYEVDASKRGMANLIAYEAITTEENSARAAYALQLAATTYMAKFLSVLAQGLVVLGKVKPKPQK